MVKALKIGVKFCGSCNPHYDTGALLRKIMAEVPEAIWLPADSPEKELLLVISGCEVDCATRPAWSGPTIVVAGETVDIQPYSLAELPKVVSSRLEVIKDELARGL